MLKLISKLQHNSYEKSEFSDEQPRDLDETIRLIKDFPWDAERALTDIQLTGPSVTIIDNDLNYLKVGLFFNGKFCVYYLDNHNHLYEYHAPTIDEAGKLVSDFFNETLNLKSFEKHFFNIGNKPNFITSDFVYRVNPVKIFALAAGFSLYLLFAIGFGLINAIYPGDAQARLLTGVVITLLGLLIGYVVVTTMNGRHQYLQISRGNNLFSYGYDDEHILTYDKRNIEVINYWVSSKGRVRKVEIIFKDDKFIRPKYLIDGHTLLEKFPEKLTSQKNKDNWV